MTITLQKVPSDPTLADLLNLHKKDILLSLNCHAIATVQSFDAENQTVTAKIVYQKTSFVQNQESGIQSPVLSDYPLLVDVPVIILGGGGFNLTFPISPGDDCLILFNDRDLDNWFAGLVNGPVNSGRLHSFSDGLALVGFPSLSTVSSTHALISKGTTELGVSATQIRIANSTATLFGALENLINGILGATAGGSPIVDVTGKIALAFTELEALLE